MSYRSDSHYCHVRLRRQRLERRALGRCRHFAHHRAPLRKSHRRLHGIILLLSPIATSMFVDRDLTTQSHNLCRLPNVRDRLVQRFSVRTRSRRQSFARRSLC